MKLIGITSSRTENRTFLNNAYMAALLRPGIVPVALPIISVPSRETITQDEYEDQHADVIAEYVARLDGIVLSGGADWNPVTFDDVNWGSVSCDGERDMMELALIHAFIEAGKPILGVCRGYQGVNLALGLSHFQQDLGMTGELHASSERDLKDRQEPVHTVGVYGDYRQYLRDKTGRADLSTLRTMSHHHQGFTLSPSGKPPEMVVNTGGKKVRHAMSAEQMTEWLPAAITAYEEAHDISIISSTQMVIEGVEKAAIKYVGHAHHPEESGPAGLAIGYWIDKYVNAQPEA